MASIMKTIHLLCLATLLCCRPVSADEKMAEPAAPKPMKSEYWLYSGDLEEAMAPTKTDRKLSVIVSGQAAKDIFDSIYPDSKAVCSDEKGERLRSKGELWCAFSPAGGYRCYFGFDLRTGKSISGASC